MYLGGIGAGTATVATATVMTLPNTGSNAIVSFAVSIAVGLMTWGLLYKLKS
jgi:LPXTG-motif cell wall-anchored protein